MCSKLLQMEVIINNRRVKYEDGEIYTYFKWGGTSKIYKWYLLKGAIHKETGYRIVKINYKNYQYHRVIYKLYNPDWNINDNSKKNLIDHIDRNRLNNNIENLRVVTQQQNQFNTNCKGYCWDKGRNKWRVEITVNRKKEYVGYFINEEDAKNKYLELKKIYHVIN